MFKIERHINPPTFTSEFINGKYDTVLIIGNGFDKSFGLNTGYAEFIKSKEFKYCIKEKNKFALYLIDKPKLERWIDIENQLSIYSLERDYKDDSFHKEFKQLSLMLGTYLQNQQITKIDKTSEQYGLIEMLTEGKSMIIDFNYTNTIESIFSTFLTTFKSKIEHLKIHGSLFKNDFIFGVEDNANIRSDDIFLKKSFNKNFTNKRFFKALNECKTLIVFGHSLGKTDHMYFDQAFKNLAKDKDDNQMKQLNFFHFKEKGYLELHKELDVLTKKSIGKLKLNNNVTFIDTSKKNTCR